MVGGDKLRSAGIYPRCVVCADNVTNNRPAPEMNEECMRQSGLCLRPSGCRCRGKVFIFDDTVRGCQAAAAAKGVALGVTTYSSQLELWKYANVAPEAFALCKAREESRLRHRMFAEGRADRVISGWSELARLLVNYC